MINNCIFCKTSFDEILNKGKYVQIYNHLGEILCSCKKFKLFCSDEVIYAFGFYINNDRIYVQDKELMINDKPVKDIVIDDDNFNLNFFIRVIENKDLF